jgi:LysM repeat protein
MHNATTKQRLSALRRKLGIFSGGWVKERRARLAALQAALTPPGAFARPAAACAGGPAPSAFLATSLPPPSGSPPPPEPTSTRWVSDSMIVPATKEIPRPKAQPAPSADPGRTTEMFDAPGEARKSRSRWIVAIAAAGVALAAVLFLTLRSPAPAPSPLAPAPSPPAPAAAAPAPAEESAMLPPLQSAPPLAAAPAPAPATAASPVVVRRGDTLWALAASHLGDPLRWPRLHRANRDRIRDPDLIYPGQRLDLPVR